MEATDSSLQILVIDDDERHAASVRQVLTALGYHVETEADSTQGLERLRTQPVDILLLDLNMPGYTGLDILHKVQPEKRGIKTIVLSGETDLDQVTPILRLGAYDYLPKPYNPDRLIASIRNAESQLQLERKNLLMQAETEAANQRHEFLVNASPDMIFVLDQDGHFTFINNKLHNIFNYDAQELIGAHWSTIIDPSLRELLRHHMNERRTGDRATRHMEFDYRDPDGKLHVIELSAMGIYQSDDVSSNNFSGTYGIVRDVTETRKTSRVLAQSQQKFYGLFMNSPDAVFISHLDDATLIEGNDNFANMMAEIAKGDLATDFPVWGSAEVRQSFIDGLNRSPSRHQMVLERKLDEGTRVFEITARRLELDGVDCLMASLKDLTAQKEAEQDRLNLETQLAQASKMEAIGQLAGGIAHDFNNILASIIGYSELAMVTLEPDNPAQSHLTEVVSAGQRARDLISQMLTFTRAHRGHAHLTRIDENINEVSRMLRAAIPKMIDIETELDPDLPAVLIDPVQLQQIIINLLINARDAIDGSGRITVKTMLEETQAACASCGTDYTGQYVVLSVRDTGHGIPSHMVAKVFDMFVSTREPGRGTGIGLWLIHTIVHEYEGHIAINSSPTGTEFRIMLPAGERPEPKVAPDTEQDVSRQTPCDGRIVVVDDEVSVGNFIGEVLRNSGYEVAIFNDSGAALSYVAETDDDIALVMTDQAMPQVTGLEIAEAAKSRQPALPVVIVTGYADKADNTRMKQLGVEQLLEKPFRIEALLKAVREHALRSQ